LYPVDGFREIFGIAEIEYRQFALKKIRAVAGEFGQGAV
jgi:hypothetical protein